jgi:hypothetical protein
LEEASEPSIGDTESVEDKKPAAIQHENDIERELADSMDSETVDSEKMVAEAENDMKKPAAVERETSGTSKETDESFASDAIGIGDVAEAMGTTLDIVAGVISEMLSEADSHENAPETTPPSVDSNQKNTEENKPAAIKTETDSNSKEAGALILESVLNADNTGEPVEKEESEWHVVEAGDEAVSPDEEIARAAEMLGSALFHSDLRSSEENVSTLSSSDSFSLGTSVPSTVPSISLGTHSSHVAAAQRNVWASHLEKLSELGFNNESLCVEILERLKAANIGVGSDDDISVTQVVNEILEEK